MNNLPYHLTEDNFRRFEPLIAQAVNNWPKETSFEVPSGVAPTTFLARFRDSIASLVTHGWETTLIDIPKLTTLRADKAYGLWPEPGSNPPRIWFRERRRAGRPAHFVVKARAEIGDSSEFVPDISHVPWRDATEEEIRSLAVLIHYGRIVGTYQIVGKVAKELSEGLSGSYNVSFHFDETSNMTIIT